MSEILDVISVILFIIEMLLMFLVVLDFALLCSTNGKVELFTVFRKKRKETVLSDVLDPQEAVDILCKKLLSDDYYIADPVGERQANAIIVKDILEKYTSDKIYVIHEKEKTENDKTM